MSKKALRRMQILQTDHGADNRITTFAEYERKPSSIISFSLILLTIKIIGRACLIVNLSLISSVIGLEVDSSYHS